MYLAVVYGDIVNPLCRGCATSKCNPRAEPRNLQILYHHICVVLRRTIYANPAHGAGCRLACPRAVSDCYASCYLVTSTINGDAVCSYDIASLSCRDIPVLIELATCRYHRISGCRASW